MKPALNIVKIGGNIIEDEASLNRFLSLFSVLKGHKILVHGGGKKASSLNAQLGLKTRMHQGRRITDEKGLEVVVMTYAGLLNKQLVAKLQNLNCNALGLSGADGNAVLAHKRPIKEIDYGFAGDIDSVNVAVVSSLLKSNLVPVFCAITHDGNGQLLNTNADTIASELATSLSTHYEVTLYYCFEKKGVLLDLEDDNSLVPYIDWEKYQELMKAGYIADGMLPKLHNCFRALDNGVNKVCIGNLTMLDPEVAHYTTISL